MAKQVGKGKVNLYEVTCNFPKMAGIFTFYSYLEALSHYNDLPIPKSIAYFDADGRNSVIAFQGYEKTEFIVPPKTHEQNGSKNSK